MKLSQLHEVGRSDMDERNPEYDAYVQKEIADNYYSIEDLTSGGYVPLDPEGYDAAQASQETIDDWFNILVVNDTDVEDYAQALNQAQTPMQQFLIKHADDYVHHEVAPQLKSIADQLGDRFTISQLAAANQQWLAAVSKNVYSYEDIANNDDLGQSYADDRDERADPYGFRGVSRSDFM